MGTYSKQSCPNCNTVIRGWHQDSGLKFGNPLSICPKCGITLIDRNKAEYIMYGCNKFLYIRHYFWEIIAGLFCGYAVGGFISMLMGLDGNNLVTCMIIIGTIVFVLWEISGNKAFKREIKESLERTKDLNYVKKLYEARLITKEKYEEIKKESKQTNSNDEEFTCDNCGYLVSASEKKCPKCGDSFEEGNELDENTKPSKNKSKNAKNETDMDKKYADLNKLKKLLDKDIITKEEFEKEKKKILKE